jgi:hypothetical protein
MKLRTDSGNDTEIEFWDEYESAAQSTEETDDRHEAHAKLDALKLQDGYIAGRVVDHLNTRKQRYTVQAFFDDAPEATWLPDGMRRVYTPAWMLT